MADATFSRPQVNGILETSLYVERPAQSVEFYRRVFGFEPPAAIWTQPDSGRRCRKHALALSFLQRKWGHSAQTPSGVHDECYDDVSPTTVYILPNHHRRLSAERSSQLSPHC